MYDALVNIFRLIYENVNVPIFNALNETRFFQTILDFINGVLTSVTRLWNNNNSFDTAVTNSLISSICGVIVFIIIIEITYAIFRIVFKAFEAIQNNINSFDNKQRWKKRGGHKKK